MFITNTSEAISSLFTEYVNIFSRCDLRVKEVACFFWVLGLGMSLCWPNSIKDPSPRRNELLSKSKRYFEKKAGVEESRTLRLPVLIFAELNVGNNMVIRDLVR